MMVLMLRFRVALLLAALSAFAQQEALQEQSRQGKQLMTEGRYAEAVGVYRGLVKALPGETGMLLNLGMAQHLAGDYAASIVSLTGVLKAQPALPPALLMLSASYMKTGKPAEAIPVLRKMVNLEPGHVGAIKMLAEAYTQLDRHEEAAAQLRRIVELQPDDARAWYLLGTQYEALAGAAFTALEKSAPESGYFLSLVAGSRTRGKQDRSAFYFYRLALRREPKLRGVHLALAEIYRRSGHAGWAAQEEAAEGKLNCALEKLACDFAAVGTSTF